MWWGARTWLRERCEHKLCGWIRRQYIVPQSKVLTLTRGGLKYSTVLILFALRDVRVISLRRL